MDDLHLKIKRMNKLGVCPHCNTDWDGGDIYEVIVKLDVYTHKNAKEIKLLAESFGWSEFDKKHFTNVTVHTIEGITYFKCHNMKCGYVFNSETGEEFDSLNSAKNSNLKTQN